MVMREVGGAGVRGAAWSAPDPLAKRGAMSGATPELGTDSWDRGGGLGFVLEHVCVRTKPKQAIHGPVSPRRRTGASGCPEAEQVRAAGPRSASSARTPFAPLSAHLVLL